LDRRGEIGKIPLEQIHLYKHHVGIPIEHSFDEPSRRTQPSLTNNKTQEKKKSIGNKSESNPITKAPVVAFHPLVQYFDVTYGDSNEDGSKDNRKSVPQQGAEAVATGTFKEGLNRTILLSKILGDSEEHPRS
jgi:hypothetical protein